MEQVRCGICESCNHMQICAEDAIYQGIILTIVINLEN